MDDVRTLLLSLADEGYREFTQKITPNAGKVFGVRLPALRKIAKDITRVDWRAYLACDYDSSFEEILIQGMVIGYAKAEPVEILRYVHWFVPKINNWAVCDCFVGGLKFTSNNKELLWDFLQPYINSAREFEIRFGVVMLLNYFVQEDYLERMFAIFDKAKQDDYYAQMAIAWAVSICYVHFPEQTEKYLQNNRLHTTTFQKSLQKIIESNRVDQQTKERIRSYRRFLK